MNSYYKLLARLTSLCAELRREHGQTFTEYAIIVGVIAVGTVAAVGFLRDAITSVLSDAANDI